MKFVVVAASCLLVVASPALAQMGASGTSSPGAGIGARDVVDIPEGPSTTETGAGESGEHLVCRRVETESSSRMATRRICLTAEQWRHQQARRN